jgi:hypothetical protein
MSSEEERIIALATSGFNFCSIFLQLVQAVLALIPFSRQLNISGSLRLGIRERKRERHWWMKWQSTTKERMQQRKQHRPRQIMRKGCDGRWGQMHSENEAKGQKVDALKTLWEHYKDVPLESIVLPEEEDEPAVPAIQNTALGDASADLLEGVANPWIDNSRHDRIIKLCELIDDKLNEGGDDISIN